MLFRSLLSLDATTIKLCLALFPWASFRQAKGGIKVHTLLDHDGHIPAFATVTDARTHESRIAQAMELPRGSIVVFDKGFTNYPWMGNCNGTGLALSRSLIMSTTRKKSAPERSILFTKATLGT